MAESKKRASQKTGASLLSLQASGFAVMILVLLVAGVVILAPTLRVLAQQRQEIVELRETLAQAEQDVVDLEEQRERWNDPAFIETQARERLMFVYPGDITYLVLDDVDDDDEVDITASVDIQQARTDWRAALLGSYLVAATTSRVQDSAVRAPSAPLPSPNGGAQ